MTPAVLILIGVLMVLAGVALFSLPAALIVLGVVLTAAGFEMTA